MSSQLPIGSVIDSRYHLSVTLGEPAPNITIYSGNDSNLGRAVSVVVDSSGSGDSSELLARAKKFSGASSSQIDSANVNILDIGTHDNFSYVITNSVWPAALINVLDLSSIKAGNTLNSPETTELPNTTGKSSVANRNQELRNIEETTKLSTIKETPPSNPGSTTETQALAVPRSSGSSAKGLSSFTNSSGTADDEPLNSPSRSVHTVEALKAAKRAGNISKEASEQTISVEVTSTENDRTQKLNASSARRQQPQEISSTAVPPALSNKTQGSAAAPTNTQNADSTESRRTQKTQNRKTPATPSVEQTTTPTTDAPDNPADATGSSHTKKSSEKRKTFKDRSSNRRQNSSTTKEPDTRSASKNVAGGTVESSAEKTGNETEDPNNQDSQPLSLFSELSRKARKPVNLSQLLVANFNQRPAAEEVGLLDITGAADLPGIGKDAPRESTSVDTETSEDTAPHKPGEKTDSRKVSRETSVSSASTSSPSTEVSSSADTSPENSTAKKPGKTTPKSTSSDVSSKNSAASRNKSASRTSTDKKSFPENGRTANSTEKPIAVAVPPAKNQQSVSPSSHLRKDSASTQTDKRDDRTNAAGSETATSAGAGTTVGAGAAAAGAASGLFKLLKRNKPDTSSSASRTPKNGSLNTDTQKSTTNSVSDTAIDKVKKPLAAADLHQDTSQNNINSTEKRSTSSSTTGSSDSSVVEGQQTAPLKKAAATVTGAGAAGLAASSASRNSLKASRTSSNAATTANTATENATAADTAIGEHDVTQAIKPKSSENRIWSGFVVIAAAIIALAVIFLTVRSIVDTTQDQLANPTPTVTEEQTPPPPAPPARPIISGVSVIDPYDGVEYDELLPALLDDDPTSVWRSYDYYSPQYGGLMAGMGLGIDLQEPSKVKRVVVDGNAAGGYYELRTTAQPNVMEGSTIVATGSFTAPSTVIELPEAVDTQHLILWVPELPNVAGYNRLEISSIHVES